MIGRQRHGVRPKLGHVFARLNVNVCRLLSFVAVKEEAVTTDSQHCRHRTLSVLRKLDRLHNEPPGGSPAVRQLSIKVEYRGREKLSPTRYRTDPSVLPLALPSVSSLRVTRTEVVNISPAMEAALRRALFTTLAGSMMPALYISTYLPLLAS